MDLTIRTGDLMLEAADLCALGVFEGEPPPAGAAELLPPGDFTGRAKQNVLLYPGGVFVPHRLLLAGLGSRDQATVETVRLAAATAARQAQSLRAASLTFGLGRDAPFTSSAFAQAAAEGIELGAYTFQRYRTNLTPEQRFSVERATIFVTDADEGRAGLLAGQAIARGVALARDLVNTPGADLPPALLAEVAEELGKRRNLKVTVLDKAELTAQGFGGILAVGKGSDNDPRFIILEHGTASAGMPTICLVGKGVTFDAGGIQVKTSDGMVTMKSDMGGAAAVLGALQAVAELDLPVHVIGLIPSAENMLGGSAYRPGDVVTSLSGKTIEVLNTDAEGRIILADALFYAQRFDPAAIIELSTLTGAIVVALGPHAIGLFSTDQALANDVLHAGTASGERAWQLPLWPEYFELIKSELADLKNTGGRPAGSITAGAFLASFTGDYPFAHLDIAGTAWVEKPNKPYHVEGGTGVGVRLLVEYLRGKV